MNRTNTFTAITVMLLLLLFAIPAIGQDSYLKNRWNLKLSGAPQFNINSKRQNAFALGEVNYGILNNFELGIALGFKNTQVANLKPDASVPPAMNDYYLADYISPIYNLHLNFHLLPYLVKDKNPRFDLYLAGRLGGNYIKSDYSDKNYFWNYFLGGGFAWYFTRSVGVYSEFGREYTMRRAFNFSDSQIRFGVAVKF
jgi:hypothetical protein